MLLAMNPTRVGFLCGALLSMIVLTFSLGYYLGRVSGGATDRTEHAVAETMTPDLRNDASSDRALPAIETSRSDPARAPAAVKPSTSPASPSRAATTQSSPKRASATPPVSVAARTEKPAPAASATVTSTGSSNPGQRFAIVAGSVPIGADPAAAKSEADRRVAELRTKGFREARADRVEIPGKGSFYRVVARDAVYPSINVALRDIEAMKARGEITTGWPMKIGPPRPQESLAEPSRPAAAR